MHKKYTISGTNDRLYIVNDFQQEVRLNAEGFFKSLLYLPSDRSLDLLRIAVGIHAVDRIAKRRPLGEAEEHSRRLHFDVAVRDASFWSHPDNCDLLADIVRFLTGDDWSFHFCSARNAFDEAGHQEYLNLARPFSPKHVALYSDGLDSAAGLANRLLDGADQFVLVTVGHNSRLHRRINTQLDELRRLMALRVTRNARMLQSTLTTHLVSGKAKRVRDQELTQRSRMFMFCAAATIAASAYDVDKIEVFENGAGAINLPLMTGMLGNGLATRSAHPTFLMMMSRLASRVTSRAVEFVLPFKLLTKAEMLIALRKEPGIIEWTQKSRSCVHSIRQAGKSHCGTCPACVERRQAFFCAGVEEQRGEYQSDVLCQSASAQPNSEYLAMYRLQATRYLSGDIQVARRLYNHLRLTGVPREEDGPIVELLSRHSIEASRTFGPLL